jgi:16S rRNA (cytosine1402-N4)-methyltransferase
MNQQASLSAETIVNKYSEEQLANILFEYGELRNSRVLAKRIIDSRKKQRIETTQELKEILRNLVPEKYEHKTFAVIFQAIRIEVNQEMESLKEFLTQIPSILDPEGRLCVISYHSLEDRLVKRFIKDGHFNAEVNKDFFGNTSAPIKAVGKLIRPSNEEIKGNNRARSARLRVAKLAE